MCDPSTGRLIFKLGEERLSDLISDELGVSIDPATLRIFIRAHWETIAPAAHEIHSAKFHRPARAQESAKKEG